MGLFSKKSEDKIELGDTVVIENEFGKEISGKVVNTKASGIKSYYGVDDGRGQGSYVRSANEIKKKK